MTVPVPLSQLREEAIALRRLGKSRREIKEILQIRSNGRLNDALQGEPPLPSTWRPNAKDDLRAKARELRRQGLDYKRIAAELGVSKSSVSLWVRDLPRPERLSYGECRQRQGAGVAAYWATERARRQAFRESVKAAARSELGLLTDRETLIAGAIAYWCEGAKNKPGRPRCDRVMFANSDPAMIRFFIRFLDIAGVERKDLVCRVYIHQTADVEAAQRYWLEVTGCDLTQFRRPSLKRHNPVTKRSNVGAEYHGCLRIEVRRSLELFQRIEGWAHAVMASPQAADLDASPD
jgi:predicted transcriptional regulator